MSGITEVDGTATDAPAFEGALTVMRAAPSVMLVIALDELIHAQLAFTTGYQR